MDNNFFFKTLRKAKVSYPNYILNDHRTKEQMLVLVQLNELNSFYSKRGVTDCIPSEQNAYFTKMSKVNWNFEVYKMKKAILSNRKYVPISDVTPSLTRFANQIFLLAMAYSRVDIVQYFLIRKLINVNQSIFGSPSWPSYFLFACTCSNEVFELFKNYRIKYNIGWNALTPYIIASYKGIELAKTAYLDFIAYKQYQLLLRYGGIVINDSVKQLPLFPLDFACMDKDRIMMKNILEEVPETGVLSRLSFIVQKEENLFLILSKYEFRPDQNFNGETPLHLSCACDDLCSMAILCNLGFEISQNYNKKWCYNVGSARTTEKATVFFNLCSYRNVNDKNKIFNHANFNEKMDQWLEILKFSPKDHLKYTGLFRYITFNKTNKILTNSRFNLLAAITMSKTPATVEGYLKVFNESFFYEKIFTDEEIVQAYRRIFN